MFFTLYEVEIDHREFDVSLKTLQAEIQVKIKHSNLFIRVVISFLAIVGFFTEWRNVVTTFSAKLSRLFRHD